MNIVSRKKIIRFIPFLKIICILLAFGATAGLVFKDLYFYEWVEKKETIIYSIPMVFLFFFWLKYKLDEENIFHLELMAVDGVAVFLTMIRLFGLSYHSGHVLFLLYTYLTTPNRRYRLLCIPMFIVTGYFKVFYWGDFVTPILGAILALLLVRIRSRVNFKLETAANNRTTA